MVCAAGSWLLTEPLLLQTLATVSAAAAVTGGVLMRRWDRSAGRRVADLTRSRAGEAWRSEERIAELETAAEEARESRLKLEAKLRAKRIELAGLRGEHAALLRRYATSETERASVLEDRRQLEADSPSPAHTHAKAGAPKALPPAPTPPRYLQAARALENLARSAAGQRRAPEQGAPGRPAPARPGALPAARPGELPPAPVRSPRPVGPGAQAPAAAPVPAPSAPVPSAAVPVPVDRPGSGAARVPAPAAEPSPAAPQGSAAVDTAIATAAPATSSVAIAEPATVTAAVAAPAIAPPAAPVPAPAAKPRAASGAGAGAPAAAAIVPYGSRRGSAQNRPEGNFDFFGNAAGGPSPERARKAIEAAVQEEDLADVVGEEALAERTAEPAATDERPVAKDPAAQESAAKDRAAKDATASAASPAREAEAGDVIDLTAHDETEKLDLEALRNAISS